MNIIGTRCFCWIIFSTDFSIAAKYRADLKVVQKRDYSIKCSTLNAGKTVNSKKKKTLWLINICRRRFLIDSCRRHAVIKNIQKNKNLIALWTWSDGAVMFGSILPNAIIFLIIIYWWCKVNNTRRLWRRNLTGPRKEKKAINLAGDCVCWRVVICTEIRLLSSDVLNVKYFFLFFVGVHALK